AHLSTFQRVQTFKALLGLSLRPEQKRLILAGLGEIPDDEALKLAESLLEEAEVQTEAAQAMIKIAAALPPEQSELAAASMQKVLGATNHEQTRQTAETTLKQIEANADFITVWQVAGPYRQANKDYAALFEIPFAPELPDSQGVKWQILPGGSDPKRPWLMDFFKAFGGQQCVAYARTWVRCDQPQPGLLEIGSDDGVKVWLNDKQVHANNAARALQPGSDKINVQLNKGWNVLVLKVTQNNQGWEFCARLRKPDGTHMAGLQFDTSNNSR
ncbi:MAG TPA: HEAT repeat domain-containing protein, partial [Bacillota bacterium]|nr:HEAT repeat domain-containing protein [Bacillota bacterium]